MPSQHAVNRQMRREVTRHGRAIYKSGQHVWSGGGAGVVKLSAWFMGKHCCSSALVLFVNWQPYASRPKDM